MLLQKIQFQIKLLGFDANKGLTTYSVTRIGEHEKPNYEVTIPSDQEVKFTQEIAETLLGLNILSYELHAEVAYNNFNQELIKGLLTGHEHKINEFDIFINQIGTNFQLSGVEDPSFKRFEKGCQVVMFGSQEATLPENESKVWTCESDSFMDKGGVECVHLEGFSGAYFCKYLHPLQLYRTI